MRSWRVLKIGLCGLLCACIVMDIFPCTSGQVRSADQTGDASSDPGLARSGNSVICGYVYDNATGDPLDLVDVELYWSDAQGNYGDNFTQTDATGLYLFHTGAVDFGLYFNVENYFPENSPWMTIGNNEIYWYNISLIPIPPQTVHFCGFITDNVSGEPLDEAVLSVYWNDSEQHYWEGTFWSNVSGFYSFDTFPGRNQLVVDHSNYYGYGTMMYVENDTTVWLNISLNPYPAISAFVQGYVTDADLGIPIPDAQVNIYCDTEYGQFYNYTYTDETGFYRLGTVPGFSSIMTRKNYYLHGWSPNFEVYENDTLWMNVTMTFYPSESSVVRGYVVDSGTHAPVRNAHVQLQWKDIFGHTYSTDAITDRVGYYRVSAPEGTIQCLLTAAGYVRQQTAWQTLPGYSTLWLNASLSPEITVEFSKPLPGVTINNESRFPMLSKVLSRFFPGSWRLIIGALEIAVNITTSTSGCNRVLFYIDDVYRGTDSEAPFTYYWNDTGGFSHEIRVVAYDNAGPCRIETIKVWKIG